MHGLEHWIKEFFDKQKISTKHKLIAEKHSNNGNLGQMQANMASIYN